MTVALEEIQMTDAPIDLLVAVYPHLDAAESEFDALVQQVAEKGMEIEGAILVTQTRTTRSPCTRPAITLVARALDGEAA
jgi:hypothetical protein